MRGGASCLKWEDIDLGSNDLRVKRQIARINGEVIEAPLKTKNAYRTLPLAENTIGVLEAQRKKTGRNPWVFPSPTGGPVSSDSVLHMLRRVLKRAELPRVEFHDLRHTFMPPWRSRTGFILDTYTHATTPPTVGGEGHGEPYLRWSPALTVPKSRMGHGLGQTKTA